MGRNQVRLLSVRRWVGRKVAGAKRHGHHRKNEAVVTRYNYAGVKWLDINVHLVPSHHVRLAWLLARLQMARITTYMRTRRRVTTAGGDFNEILGFKRSTLRGLRKIARPFTMPSFKVGRDGRGGRAIDYFWLLKRQLRKRDWRIELTRLDHYPGHNDHLPLMITIYED